jgi:hypothetical protein
VKIPGNKILYTARSITARADKEKIGKEKIGRFQIDLIPLVKPRISCSSGGGGEEKG